MSMSEQQALKGGQASEVCKNNPETQQAMIQDSFCGYQSRLADLA